MFNSKPMTLKKATALIIINLAMFLLTFGPWVYMTFFGKDHQTLTSIGFESLKYYTVLSNLFEGAVALIFAVALILKIRKKDFIFGKILLNLKLAAAGVVAITFLVIALFLGPIYGMLMMYQGANFWLHLIVPLMAMTECIFLLPKLSYKIKHLLLCVVPTVLYGAGYLINLLVNGIEGNDFYYFARWGYGVGMIIFAAIALLNFGVVALLGKLNRIK